MSIDWKNNVTDLFFKFKLNRAMQQQVLNWKQNRYYQFNRFELKKRKYFLQSTYVRRNHVNVIISLVITLFILLCCCFKACRFFFLISCIQFTELFSLVLSVKLSSNPATGCCFLIFHMNSELWTIPVKKKIDIYEGMYVCSDLEMLPSFSFCKTFLFFIF